MSKRSVLHFVKDMLDAIEKVERYIEGQTYESFAENDMLLDATGRNLEIIGEAARHIPTNCASRILP